MPIIQLLYSPGVPTTYSIDVEVDLGDEGIDTYDRALMGAIFTHLKNEFHFRSTNPGERGADFAFYDKESGELVPQERLNDAAQEAVYNHFGNWPNPGLK